MQFGQTKSICSGVAVTECLQVGHVTVFVGTDGWLVIEFFGVTTEADEAFGFLICREAVFSWGISEMLGLRVAEIPRSLRWAMSGSNPLSFEIT